MGFWLVRPVSLRSSGCSQSLASFSLIRSFLDPLSTRVAPQYRIFANGVYRQFPAPDFNRLASPLPRRTVRLE